MDARCLNSEAEGKNAARGLGPDAPFKKNTRPSITNAILHNTIYTPWWGKCFSCPAIAYKAWVLCILAW